MIEWGPFGEKTQRKNKPGIDFKSIPGSFMPKIALFDTMQPFFSQSFTYALSVAVLHTHERCSVAFSLRCISK